VIFSRRRTTVGLLAGQIPALLDLHPDGLASVTILAAQVERPLVDVIVAARALQANGLVTVHGGGSAAIVELTDAGRRVLADGRTKMTGDERRAYDRLRSRAAR